MYEAFFGLRRRPFSPLPRVDSFVPVAPSREPLNDLIRCIEQDQGVGVLTGPAGSGKSLLCRMLYQHFSGQQRTVLLTTGRFPTRRAILQAILFELKHPYVGLSEQEARLTILDLLESSPPPSDRMLLIVDEAHQLSPRGLEELRTLSDYVAAQNRRVSLILAGQLALEEVLTDSALDALNQRVGCHVCIEPLTMEESFQYIADRLSFAGNCGLMAFTQEALHLIATASEGNPRRLNQLCDHALLLAFAEEERPVSVATVRSALLDLRELPLHWNTPVDLSDQLARNPLEGIAHQYADVDMDTDRECLDDDPLTSSSNDDDSEVMFDGQFDQGDHESPVEDETTAFAFEVGASLDETPFDQLFQVKKFVVPPSLREYEDASVQATTHSTTDNALDQRSNQPTTEHFHSMDRGEPMTKLTAEFETCMSISQFYEADDSAHHRLSVPQPLAPDYDELIVEDNYAQIDRRMEDQYVSTRSTRPHETCTQRDQIGPLHQPSFDSLALLPSGPLPAETSIYHPLDGIPAVNDEVPVSNEQKHEWMENQVLELIHEIDADVRHYREQHLSQELDKVEPGRNAVAGVQVATTGPVAPPVQSLRQSLNWIFDVVEPDSQIESPNAIQEASTQCDQELEVKNDPRIAEVLMVTNTLDAPIFDESAGTPDQPTERRYSQLFTRLQRQRRRVESVMNKERHSSCSPHHR